MSEEKKVVEKTEEEKIQEEKKKEFDEQAKVAKEFDNRQFVIKLMGKDLKILYSNLLELPAKNVMGLLQDLQEQIKTQFPNKKKDGK